MSFKRFQLSHQRAVSYLENHDLAIVGLQVEGPGRGDEALSRADDVIAPAGHRLHHRGGLWAQSHGLQLQKNKKKRESDRVI